MQVFQQLVTDLVDLFLSLIQTFQRFEELPDLKIKFLKEEQNGDLIELNKIFNKLKRPFGNFHIPNKLYKPNHTLLILNKAIINLKYLFPDQMLKDLLISLSN